MGGSSPSEPNIAGSILAMVNSCHIARHANGYIAQWLERLTADQQVPGSNPGVPSVTYRKAYFGHGRERHG
jgi:hypothetical protein